MHYFSLASYNTIQIQRSNLDICLIDGDRSSWQRTERMAKSPDPLEERLRDDLRPKSGDTLKVHTIKYSRATAIKAVYHATVSRRLFETARVAVVYYMLR